MYLIYSKKTNRILEINDKPFISYDKNLYQECYIEELPIKTNGQYYSVSNVREETKIIRESYMQEEFDEQTQEKKFVEYPAETKTYLTCDIVVKEKSQAIKEREAKIIAKRNAIKEIEELKQLLTNTDYQAIKYAEGYYTEEDYALIKAQRQSWRDRINELENKL